MVEGIWHRDHFTISSDPQKTDVEAVTNFLKTSYWASHVPRDHIIASIKSSLVYNLIDDRLGQQVGFARVVTDHVRLAYMCDVFILDDHQGQGLGAWLIETAMADPRLAGIGHWVLATSDAQPFYRKLGFVEAETGRYMVLKKEA